MSSPLSHLRILFLTGLVGLLGACGGGTSSSSDPGGDPPGPPPPPPAVTAFAATAGSAHVATLAWTPADGVAYTVERRGAEGAWAAIGTLPAGSAGFVDTGLDAHTAYTYRVWPTAGASDGAPERSVQTGDEEAVATGVGAPIGEAATLSLGAAAAHLAATGAPVALDAPAGAFAAATQATLVPVANTAPDGTGAGLAVHLAAAPALPLALSVVYDAALDAQADALRIAVQMPDGSWMSLPSEGLDRDARTLAATLPPQLLAAAPRMRGAAGTATGIDFTVVAYLGFSISPEQATVHVGDTQSFMPRARVRGYEITIGGGCRIEDGDMVCSMPVPVMETRELPLLNAKAGYERQWLVGADVGGDATYGTVAPQGAAGGLYTAPAMLPQPSTVLVSFTSRDLASGRTLTLAARVALVDDAISGALSATDGPSSAGTTVLTSARVTWHLDPGASADGVRRYIGLGTIQITIADDNCVSDISPETGALSDDPRFVYLEIDDNVSPARYHFEVVTFWPATITATCSGHTASTDTMAGWAWEESGTVAGDGTIMGNDEVDGTRIGWHFAPGDAAP